MQMKLEARSITSMSYDISTLHDLVNEMLFIASVDNAYAFFK